MSDTVRNIDTNKEEAAVEKMAKQWPSQEDSLLSHSMLTSQVFHTILTGSRHLSLV